MWLNLVPESGKLSQISMIPDHSLRSGILLGAVMDDLDLLWEIIEKLSDKHIKGIHRIRHNTNYSLDILRVEYLFKRFYFMLSGTNVVEANIGGGNC